MNNKNTPCPKLSTYLTFNGQCSEAFHFYEKILNCKISFMQTFKHSPMSDQIPKEYENQIIHATLILEDQILMASDSMPGKPYEEMKGFSLSLNYPTASEAKNVFEKLSEGGQMIMPLQKTHWAEAFGMFRDRFGTPWMINCHAT